uniref:Mpr protein n=1 Tax=Aliarcobacter butzleri TaxID=28197 RepID=W0LZH1_9BACT|nr:SprT-like domain-containing protein [Aliarcobacter butzleri]AHG28749.1 Mpr protein [Aliarcobacter butzleri]
MQKFSPTKDFYDLLQELYYIFNKELFEDKLPNCLITVQRRKKVMGYFSANRWVNDKKIQVHELALNPTYFASCNFIELFQTIVHEMCHLWQFEYGKPSIKTYHNKEWANKMESIGLIPSSTGRIGGKKTGQFMNDYPERGGIFENLCIRLFKEDMFIKWFDRFPQEIYHNNNLENPDSNNKINDIILESLYTPVSNVVVDIVSIEEIKALNLSKQKTKYLCPNCKSAVWGRNNLNIKCNSCQVDFKIVSNQD